MRDDVSWIVPAAATGSCVDLPCPKCGPQRQSPANRVRKVLRVWALSDGRHSYVCARCGAQGVTSDPNVLGVDAGERGQIETNYRSRAARTLWRRSASIQGTPAERYLREGRAYQGSLPPTLRYLPPNDGYPHSMIAALGNCPESAPGELGLPRDSVAVHLTRLAPKGLARLDKRMLGPVSGNPIVLAPPNDGLGLVITEGIEDALSLHEATGLGAWAAGSATHMAKLADAVPDYVSCVTLAQDDDAAGRTATNRLGAALVARGFEVRILSLAQAP